ncbi:MAG: ABC transporter ATP-binding protein [Thermoproteota archaeon]
MEAIRVESVNKSFGPVRAVKDLNLLVEAGEIRGLLGPNGSGKSTTMKIILGILKPDSGIVNVCGLNVKEKPIDAKNIMGYVPETPHLYEYLTVAEYLDFVGIAYGIEPKIRKQRVKELLQAFQMEEHLNEVMSGFSQGMKQKIAITGALLHRPKVIILDEPLNGLDPRSARIVKDLLYRLATEGEAILFSTHILEIAEAICHRVTIMNEGSVLAEGSVQELRSMMGLPNLSLEEVFLKLTGSEDTAKIVEALRI